MPDIVHPKGKGKYKQQCFPSLLEAKLESDVNVVSSGDKLCSTDKGQQRRRHGGEG